MATEGGFVYVLSNECMPGIVKIGQTRRLPVERSRELYQTGVPVPFVIELAIYSKCPLTDEAGVHDALEWCRVSPGREFFRTSVDDAIQEVICVVLSDLGICAGPEASFFDPGDLSRYSSYCDVDPMVLGAVMSYIEPDEWKCFGERMRKRRKQIQATRAKRLEASDG